MRVMIIVVAMRVREREREREISLIHESHGTVGGNHRLIFAVRVCARTRVAMRVGGYFAKRDDGCGDTGGQRRAWLADGRVSAV